MASRREAMMSAAEASVVRKVLRLMIERSRRTHGHVAYSIPDLTQGQEREVKWVENALNNKRPLSRRTAQELWYKLMDHRTFDEAHMSGHTREELRVFYTAIYDPE